jgi:nucleoside-diphosphate kinase
MANEMTFSIIKPNAVKKNAIGDIVSMFEANGLKIAAAKLTVLSRKKCEEFYAEHKARPFFGELVDFMTSGPVVLLALAGENAVAKNREIMGATDPKKATVGTVLFTVATAQLALSVNSLCSSKKLKSQTRKRLR